MFDKPCEKCQSYGFCKCRQAGKGAGMGQKSRIKQDIGSRKERSKAQERNLAKSYKEAGFEKARRVPGSGAFHEAMLYADVDPGEMYLAEAKQSRTGKLIIEPAWMAKVREEAAALNRKYIMHAWVAAGEENFTKVVVMDETTWLDFLTKYKSKEEEDGL